MQENHKLTDFLESSKKEAFLQSESWRKFQESTGKTTFHIEDILKPEKGKEAFYVWANVIENKLPIVGKYFYIPRGPILIGEKDINLIRVSDVKKTLDYLFWLARDNGTGWIRFDARSEKDLVLIKESFEKVDKKDKKIDIVKAPHDVQPKEIFVIDILKSEDEILSEMKSKTRYNIRLAEKRGVKIFSINKKQETRNKEIPNSKFQISNDSDSFKYDLKTGIEEFLKLNRETAERDGIVTHPDDYYRKMIETLPDEMISLFIAEYDNKIIAANLVIFFQDSATYAHGASSNENRDVMAPYLLQWRQIQEAKKRGCKFYDFGGVKTVKHGDLTPTLSLGRRGSKGEVDSWAGITRFKMGFSPKTETIVFPGSYDIIINPRKYSLYKGLQKAKGFLSRTRK